MVLIFLMFFALLVACGNHGTNPAETSRIIVENDEIKLSSRITYYDKVIPLEFSGTSKSTPKSTQNRAAFQLILRAEVKAPVLNGHTLHASHVRFRDGYVYVSYSTKNNEYRGGVEIYDGSDLSRPKLISQALFKDTDITIAAEYEGKLYLGEATDSDNDSNFESPACLEVITLDNHKLTDVTTRLDLPSFNANDVACFDNTVFVTTGTTGGGLSTFDLHSLEEREQREVHGAKAIEKSDDHILILEGTGTKLHFFDRDNLTYLKAMDLGCSNFFQSKAELDVENDIAHISAWECGVMAIDLKREEIMYTIPAPEGGQSNSVSVHDGLLFIANGSDGLVVAEINGSKYEILGTAKFEGSTNFVSSRNNQVFVANGFGGLKILEIVR